MERHQTENRRIRGPGSGLPPVAFSHVLNDGRQLERLNAEGGISVTFRPVGRCPPHLSFKGAQGDHLSLWHTCSRTGFISAPCAALDIITIRFVIEGRMIRRDRSEDHVARRGHAMLVAFDRMRDEEASPSFEAVSATLSRSALTEALAKLEGSDAVSLPWFAPVTEVAGLPLLGLLHTLRSIHSRLLAGGREADLVLPLLQEVAAYQVLSAWPRLYPGAVPREPRIGARPVRRAKDHIDAHLSRKLLLADVARAAGVGVRGLQAAFRKETGTSPSGYILGQRLERARADLQAPSERETSVTAIAERWGFTHMGDFGRRYRERFGETPTMSRTTRR